MRKGKPFSRKLLKALVISGVVTIAVINPFFGILAAHVAREEFQKRKWKQLQDDLYYLKKKGFIKAKRRVDGSYVVRATYVGKEQIKKYELDDIYINTPKKWDKHWRFIVFDIPATKQKNRQIMLPKLKELGFIMVQKSVWAYPFECQKEVEEMARILDVKGSVRYLVCSMVSAGDNLKEEFEKRNSTKLV